MTASPETRLQPLLIFLDKSDVWDRAVCQKLHIINNIKSFHFKVKQEQILRKEQLFIVILLRAAPLDQFFYVFLLKSYSN